MNHPDKDKMTKRVRGLVTLGYSNKEIGALLGIHRSTVIYHVMKMYRQAGIYGNADNRRFMVWILTGKLPEAPHGTPNTR